MAVTIWWNFTRSFICFNTCKKKSGFIRDCNKVSLESCVMSAPPRAEVKCTHSCVYAPQWLLISMHSHKDPNLGGMVSLLFIMFPRKVPDRMAPLWGHSQLLQGVFKWGELLGCYADMSAGERILGHLHCRPGAEVHPGTGVGLRRKSICKEGPAEVSGKKRTQISYCREWFLCGTNTGGLVCVENLMVKLTSGG